ncbi:MAG: MaoC family dehydratase N-terminal domain-containing protein [Polyangiales bacterium]
MVDHAAEGAVGVPFELDVERGKIAELARATLTDNRAYFDGDRPVSSPTFLTTMFFWEERVAGSNPWHVVAMDQQRGMHAEQEYVFHGPPPRAGAKLVGRSRIASIFEKAGRRGGALTFVVMVTEFRDASGVLVAEARLTGVETGVAPTTTDSKATAVAKPDAAHAETPTVIEGLPPAPPPRTVGPISRTDIVRYQGASGDMNPIHHDEPFARSAGYSAPLVVGMFQAGVLANWGVDWLGAENVRGFKVRWKEQVWPGDVLTFSGKVARAFLENGETRVELELTCTRQTGGVAAQAWEVFVVA